MTAIDTTTTIPATTQPAAPDTTAPAATPDTTAPAATPDTTSCRNLALTGNVDLGAASLKLSFDVPETAQAQNVRAEVYLLNTITGNWEHAVLGAVALIPGSPASASVNQALPIGTYTRFRPILFVPNTYTPVYDTTTDPAFKSQDVPGTLAMTPFTIVTTQQRVTAPQLRYDFEKREFYNDVSTALKFTNVATSPNWGGNAPASLRDAAGNPNQGVWYHADEFSIQMNVGAESRKLTTYHYTPGETGRPLTLEIVGMDGTVQQTVAVTAPDTAQGVFVSLPVEGEFILRQKGGGDTLLSGLFWDSDVIPAAPVKDLTSAGVWKGVYGKDGYVLASGGQSLPNYMGGLDGAAPKRMVRFRADVVFPKGWQTGSLYDIKNGFVLQLQNAVTGSVVQTVAWIADAIYDTDPLDSYGLIHASVSMPEPPDGILTLCWGLYDPTYHKTDGSPGPLEYTWSPYPIEFGYGAWIQKGDPSIYPNRDAVLAQFQGGMLPGINLGNSSCFRWWANTFGWNLTDQRLLKAWFNARFERVNVDAAKAISNAAYLHGVFQSIYYMLQAGIVPIIAPQFWIGVEGIIKFHQLLMSEFAGKVIPNVCNEPFAAGTWAEYKPLAEQVCQFIWAIDPTAPILVDAEGYAGDMTASSADPIFPNDSRILMGWHPYKTAAELPALRGTDTRTIISEFHDVSGWIATACALTPPIYGCFVWATTVPGEDNINVITGENGAVLTLTDVGAGAAAANALFASGKLPQATAPVTPVTTPVGTGTDTATTTTPTTDTGGTKDTTQATMDAAQTAALAQVQQSIQAALASEATDHASIAAFMTQYGADQAAQKAAQSALQTQLTQQALDAQQDAQRDDAQQTTIEAQAVKIADLQSKLAAIETQLSAMPAPVTLDAVTALLAPVLARVTALETSVATELPATVPAPTAPVEATLDNASFESPSLPVNGFAYAPTGTAWLFEGSSGIQSNGSAWFAEDVPDGTQTAFIQSAAGGSKISQSIVLPLDGHYSLTFLLARRQNQVQPLKVTLDGVQIGGLVTAAGNAFTPFTVSFSGTAGKHLLVFEATELIGDSTVFLDALVIKGTA